MSTPKSEYLVRWNPALGTAVIKLCNEARWKFGEDCPERTIALTEFEARDLAACGWHVEPAPAEEPEKLDKPRRRKKKEAPDEGA